MIGLVILLCCVITLPASVKLSMMPLKISLFCVVIWGIAGYFITHLFSGMTRQEAYALLDVRGISTLEFFELMIIGSFLFSSGIYKKILALYPCLMIIVPVSVVSLLFSGMFTGVDFYFTALISGCVISVTMIGLVLFLKYAKADSRTLYGVTIFSVLVNIIIYGLT